VRTKPIESLLPAPTPPLSKAKKQTNRRRFLRTTLLTGGVLGAALSGFLPIIYSQKKALAAARRTG
jgi:hypothetical protein